ncbi:MAG: O-antigen ligase family protein [Anaerolineaceae bacterium]|nr:O-antigen ligase family protein [Anaerolineaceae bacterium]MCB9101741.1 O-antigen ligase family protein [Anaerolineales bacterium]
MLKLLNSHRFTAIWLLLLAASTLSAAYFFNQLSLSRPPSPAGSLAADKGYGVTIDLTHYDDEDLASTLEALHAGGLTWLRQPIRWADLEPEPGHFNWQPLDRITTAITHFNQLTLSKNNPFLPIQSPTQPTILSANQHPHSPAFKLIAVFLTSPRWARAPHTTATAPPLAPSDFGRFARAFAARYHHQIAVYQIWDEPNLSANWGRTFVDAPAYAALLREGALNLREIDPEAIIMTAALAPTLETGPLNLNDIDYLDRLYQVKANRWFDIVAAQPYGFDRDPSDPAMSATLNFRRVELLRQVMLNHGDAETPIWATAFGWNALPPDWAGPKSPWKTGPPDRQARRTSEAINLARQNWPWLGPMLAIRWDPIGLEPDDPARGFALRDTPPILAALEAIAGGPTIAAPGVYPADHPSGQYSSGWRFAGTQADIPRREPRTLTISFNGRHLDLVVNRGSYRGYLWVTIDGQPANALPLDSRGRSYVVLYDPLRESTTITLARDLPPGLHQAEITAEGGWGQWTIAGWSVTNEIDSAFSRWGLIIAGLVAALSGVALTRTLAKDVSQSRRFVTNRLALFYKLDERIQFILTAAPAVGLYFGSGHFGPALLGFLAICLFLRPDFGLMLIAFSLSFLPHQQPTPLFNISLLEALLLFSAAGLIRSVASVQRSAFSVYHVSFITHHSSFNYSPFFIFHSSFLILSLLATLFAQNFGVSMLAWRTMVLGPVVFCMLMVFIAPPKQLPPSTLLWRWVDAFVFGAVIHAAIALALFFFDHQFIAAEGVRRVVGPVYPTPNNLALFLERAWPILLAVTLLPGPSRQRRGMYGLGLGVLTAALYLTFSRGTLLLALPGSLIGMALLVGFYRQEWRYGLSIIGLGLVLLLAALLPLMTTTRLATVIDYSQGTGFFRLKLWQSALMMLRDHWLLGVGLNNFLYQYRTFYILPEAWQEPNLSHPHNVVLDFGASLGVGGIMILVWLQVRFWTQAWAGYKRQPTSLLLGLMGSMIVITTHGLVDHAYFLVDLAFVFFLIFGLVQRIAWGSSE